MGITTFPLFEFGITVGGFTVGLLFAGMVEERSCCTESLGGMMLESTSGPLALLQEAIANRATTKAGKIVFFINSINKSDAESTHKN